MANAVKKELKETVCRNCNQEIVLIRTSDKVSKAIYQCPKCGKGFKLIWI